MTLAAFEQIVAGVAEQAVIAAEAVKLVGIGRAEQSVVARGADK